ncbi:Nipped-B-like protein [Dirofilaria immitis]
MSKIEFKFLMASGGKQPSQSKQKSSDSRKEEMESFMSKVCERFEKLRVISRLMEQPQEQSQGSSKSPKKSSRSRKVYQFFCDQPSTSQESKSKSASKMKQSEKSRKSKTKSSESSVSETKLSESRKPKTKSSESSVSETKLSESRKPKTKSSESSVSETKLSESRKPKTKSSESSVSETKLSESRKPKTKSSESSVSETKLSESRKPKTKSSESSVSETKPSDSVSKIKPSGSSKRTSSKKKTASIEKFDTVDLSKEHGDNWSSIPTVELPATTQSSMFDEQPYIEDPEAPSTSSGLRVIKLDDYISPEYPSRSDLSQEIEEGQSNIITTARSDDATTMEEKDYLKRPNLRSIQKKTRLSNRPEKVSAVESVALRGSRSTTKQTKAEKSTDSGSTGGKIDLKNVRAADLRGLLLFKLDEVIQNQSIPHETPKADRAQRARERLRKKFEEGQSSPSKNKPK